MELDFICYPSQPMHFDIYFDLFCLNALYLYHQVAKRRRKNRYSAYTCDVDETEETPPRASTGGEASESTAVSSGEQESAWQQYWAEWGEHLVWQGWLEKYPGYIDSQGMDHVAIPAVTEIEIAAEEEGLETETVVELENEDSHLTDKGESSSVSINGTVNSHACTEEPVSMDSPITCDTKCVSDISDKSDADKSDCSVKPDIQLKPSAAMNEAIEKTLAALSESAGSNGDIETSVNTISSMHDYCGSQRHDQSHSTDIGQHANEDVNEDPYADQWRQLWDEHYMESYWYYHEQHKYWYSQGFDAVKDSDSEKLENKCSDIKSSSCDTTEHSVSETVDTGVCKGVAAVAEGISTLNVSSGDDVPSTPTSDKAAVHPECESSVTTDSKPGDEDEDAGSDGEEPEDGKGGKKRKRQAQKQKQKQGLYEQ